MRFFPILFNVSEMDPVTAVGLVGIKTARTVLGRTSGLSMDEGESENYIQQTKRAEAI
jgi:hypothetical protein